MPRRSGFTLIELLVAIGMLAVVLGIAVPRLSGAVARSETRSASQEIASMIARSRNLAMQRRAPVRLTFVGNTVGAVVQIDGVDQRLLGPVDMRAAHHATVSSPVSVLTFDSRGFAVGLSQRYEIVVTSGDRTDAVCVTRLGNATAGRCT